MKLSNAWAFQFFRFNKVIREASKFIYLWTTSKLHSYTIEWKQWTCYENYWFDIKLVTNIFFLACVLLYSLLIFISKRYGVKGKMSAGSHLLSGRLVSMHLRHLSNKVLSLMGPVWIFVDIIYRWLVCSCPAATEANICPLHRQWPPHPSYAAH